jgi:hypothetical protein
MDVTVKYLLGQLFHLNTFFVYVHNKLYSMVHTFYFISLIKHPHRAPHGNFRKKPFRKGNSIKNGVSPCYFAKKHCPL